MVAILNLINAFTSFSLFLVLWVKFKQNYTLKYFASLSLGTMGLCYLLYGMLGFFPMYAAATIKSYLPLSVFFLVTFNYLYFKFLLFEELKFGKKEVIRIVLCTFIFGLLAVGEDNNFISWPTKIYVILAIVAVYSCFYLIQLFLMLYQKVWGPTANYKGTDAANTAYKIHTKLIFVLLSLLLVRDLQGLALDAGRYAANDYAILNIILLLLISATQLTVFFRMLLNPAILYGNHYLTTALEKQKENPLPEIWTIIPNSVIINQQDKKLQEQLEKNLRHYITIIEATPSEINRYKDSSYTIKDLSNELSIQKSHLSYIFKYHCKLSFSSYKKRNQIKEAKRLLDSNYLFNNTIESLSTEVGFLSYSPFYTNFKRFTGVSPHEYMIRKQSL